jgi:CRISPR-associated protein Csb2
MRSLLIHVNLLHPLWHGSGDWPPSPFRLFQAMVAGTFGGRWAAEDVSAREQRSQAFEWLERQQPPDIVAPPKSLCQHITSYVPNNDLDAVGGDPRRVEDIRAEKVIAPIRLEGSQTLLYAWHFETGETEARLLCELAERLHTFGRGVDPAWARAEVLDRESAESVLVAGGSVARPAGTSGGNLLPCPVEGSLQSLIARHLGTAARLSRDRTGKKILFRQPPKAHYRHVGYDRLAVCLLFEIRRQEDLDRYAPVPQGKASVLTEAVRDEVARRLTSVAQRFGPLAERFVIGRGAGPADRDRRIRIVPLPTIGHPYASPSIRRVVVEVPPDCPLAADDVRWACLGLQLPEGLSAGPSVLLATERDDMLEHYGWDEAYMRWRSVTPVALPVVPTRARTGMERSLAEARCAGAFVNALRHAGVTAPVAEIRIQREPFHVRGAAADAFEPSRFGGRLRHVEVAFQSPVRGPLVLGDGRFVGLGIMQRVQELAPGLHEFAVDQRNAPSVSRSVAVAAALRRAVMARAQPFYERQPLPVFFHGHAPDGTPDRSGNHRHLFFAAFSSNGGESIDRVAVIAPELCDRTISGRQHWRQLAEAVHGLTELRCGCDGLLTLCPLAPPSGDPVFSRGTVWTTVHAYRPTRHAKPGVSASSLIEADIRMECTRRGLPELQSVQVLSTSEGPRGGLSANVTIRFTSRVRGPVLLGHGSHLGDGLFRLA